MKRVVKLVLCMMMAVTMFGCSSESEEETMTVGIIKYTEHTSLDAIEDAITVAIENSGQDIEIIYKNAAGDTSIMTTLVEQVISQGADVIVAIATPTAQACAQFASDVPVVFAAVEDPVDAGLVNDTSAPDLNITGTSDALALDEIVALIQEVYSDTQTIGFLYNTGEANSVSSLEKFEEYANAAGMEVVKIGVTGTADISTALSTSLDKVDVVFSPTDNTIASAMTQVSEMCKDAGKAIFCGADSMVSDGGFMAYGINYEQLGTTTGEMVLDILAGSDVSEIPVAVFNEDLIVYMNQTTADSIGFDGLEAVQENYTVEIFE
ncbi:ABC transporter substrate-binding protein [Tannockella kyphosi]|uniref:ABC transporter substrate-binding protein n=1 Tax=Tannockella kyphosi TaxID=2899121 RepID=UPI002011F2A0|nr:ABC transporter substrate-binding protein [Tannockella kyphosi]